MKKTLQLLFSLLFILAGMTSAFSQTTPAGALNFDGTDDYVSVNNIGSAGDFSWEAWIKTSGNGTIISKAPATGIWNWGGKSLFVRNGKITYDAFGISYVETPSTYNDNLWHHVALTVKSNYSGNLDEVKIYVDGTLAVTRNNWDTNASSESGYVTKIGYTNYNFPVVPAFTGSIDDARFWNRTLSASEIANNKSCELVLPQTGLLAYYKFNQGEININNSSVNSAWDYSGNNLTGTLNGFTLNGATSNWVAGNLTASCSTNGPANITSGINLWLDASDANATGTNTVTDGTTLSIWRDKSGRSNDASVLSGNTGGQYLSNQVNGKPVVRFTRASSSNGSVYTINGVDIRAGVNPDVTIFTVYKPGTHGTELQGLWGNDDGAWDRFYLNHWSTGDDAAASLGPIGANVKIVPNGGKTGELKLLTAVYDGTVTGSSNSGPVNGSTIYFNGEAIVNFTDSTDPLAAQPNLRIGKDGDDNPYNGDIAEMIVYNRKLTDCEIQTINQYLSSKYAVTFTTATITPSGSTWMCYDGSLTLTASAGSSYKWYLNGNLINGATSNTYVATQAGHYTVTIVSPGGCSATSAATTINKYPPVTATATNNGPITKGNTINLTAAFGGTSYAWTGPNGFTSTQQNPGIPNATAANAGTYTVTVTQNGCTASASTEVVVNTLPATALSFGGSGDYVDLGSPLLSNTSFTKEGWFLSTDASSANNLFSTNQDPIWIPGGTLSVGQGNNYGVISDTSPFPLNTWTHVAVTYDKPANTLKLYVNGILKASKTNAPAYIGGTTYLGHHAGGGGNSSVKMDEVRFWNRALCQGEIQNNMNAELNPLGQTGLVALYHFNQGFVSGANSGYTILSDASGNNSNGTLFNFGLSGSTSNWAEGNVTGTAPTFVPPTATITASGATTICPAGSVQLTANAGASYLWNTNETTQSINASAAGSYSVKVTSENGCSAQSAAINVTVQDSQAPVLSGVPANVTVEIDALPAQGTVSVTDNCTVGTVSAYQFPSSAQKSKLFNSFRFENNFNNSKGTTNGNAVNGVSFAPGVTGTAVSFDGSSKYIDYGTAASLSGTGNFAISVWIKTSSAAPQTIIQQRDGNFNGQYMLFVGSNHNGSIITPGKVYFGVYNNGFQYEIYSNTRVDDGKWHYIVAERNGTAGRVFIDGNLDVSATGPLVALTSNIGTYVGRDVRDGSKNFNGLIDELNIYTEANCPNSYDIERTWSVSDLSGNQTAARQILTVTDTQAPVLSATPTDLAACHNAIPVAAVLTATDNSGTSPAVAYIQTSTQSADATNTAHYNYTLTRKWTATDACANVTSKVQVITVQDLIAPQITSTQGNTIVALNAEGTASLANYIPAATATDDCSSSSAIVFAQSPAAGTSLTPNVATNVTLTATDASGLKSTQTFTVTATDQTGPVVVTKNITVALNASGNATITPAQVDNGTTDNSGNFTLSLDKTTFNCANLGPNPVSLTAVDASGNTSTTIPSGLIGLWDFEEGKELKDQTGNWGDLILSGASISNGSLDVNNNTMARTSSYTGAQIRSKTLISYVSMDDLNLRSGSALTIDKLNSDAFDGIIYAEAQSNRWMNGSSNGLRNQNLNPGFAETAANQLIQVAITYQEQANNQVLIKFYRNGVAYGSYTSANFDTWFAGDAEMIFGARHFHNNTQIGSLDAHIQKAMLFNRALDASEIQNLYGAPNAVVTIIDNIAPIKPVLADVTAQCTVTVTAPTTSDNCSSVITGTTTNPLTYSTQGTHIITWSFKDASGNITTADQNVIIKDLTAPVITSSQPNVTVALSSTNGTAILANYTSTATATDNCSSQGAVIFTQSPAAGTPLAQNTPLEVTLTATDGSGLSTNQTFTVTAKDQTAPIAIAKNIVKQLNASGSVTITAAEINNGSSDNVGITSMTVSPETFNCSNVTVNTPGSLIYNMGADDYIFASIASADNVAGTEFQNGNQWYATYSGSTELVSGNSYYLHIKAINGGGPGMFIGDFKLNGDFVFENGTKTLNSGTANWSMSTSGFGSNYQTPVVLGPNGGANWGTRAGISGSAQYIWGPSNTLYFSAKIKYTGSPNTATLTVTDASGNVSTATANVTIEDKIAPVIVNNGNKVVNTGENLCGANVVVSATATDNCAVPIPTGQRSDELALDAIYPIGTTTITWTVTDIHGNAAIASVQTVTVEDHESPAVLVQNVTVQLDASGHGSTTAALVNNGSSDACGIKSIVLSKTDFDCSNAGTNEVTLTVTDIHDNVSTATAIVTVEDKVAPIALAQNITVQLDANGKASITETQINNGSTDNCSIASVVLNKTDFDCSNVGPNTVTLTITDVNGNSTSVDVTVTVEDKVAPVVLTQNITVQLDASGKASITEAQINNGSTDNCSIASYALSKKSFDCSNVGTNTITLTVTDVNGNSSSATATVTVQDNISPTVYTQNITVQLDANGSASITEAQINNGSTDNCSIASYALNKKSFDCSNVGTNTVILTVTDVNGNNSSATATVTVQDNIAPIVLTQNLLVQLDAAGKASITEAQINNGSTDNCSIASYALSKKSFDCSNIGANTVTLTVTDVNGNVSAAPATVTVQDNVAPVALTKNISVTLVNGSASITPASINNGSNDACGIQSLTIDKSNFDCSNLGNNIVVLTVTDKNGNVSSASALVNIIGVKPVASIAVTRTDNTFTGLDSKTIALGYGTQKLTLTASNSTSAANATTYVWSPATGLSSVNIANPVFTPTAAGIYTFNVITTNEFGCTASASVTITVLDVRCGNKNDKVLVCHKTGSAKNPWNQICISPNAVDTHLRNGGTLGTCPSTSQSVIASTAGSTELTLSNNLNVSNSNTLSAYPNPFVSETTVTFNLATEHAKVSLDMYDLKGVKITNIYSGKADALKDYSFNFNGTSVPAGVYFFRLTASNGMALNFKVIVTQ